MLRHLALALALSPKPRSISLVSAFIPSCDLNQDRLAADEQPAAWVQSSQGPTGLCGGTWAGGLVRRQETGWQQAVGQERGWG